MHEISYQMAVDVGLVQQISEALVLIIKIHI